ncbi:MAG: ATP-binding protein [Rhodopseudomonas palustris]|nr:ATP-binding protein [Rhodopseudomonas palustris]
MREHFESLAQQAAAEQWSHVEFLARLIEGEAHRREQRSIQRRVGLARFPVLKSLDQFDWNWPKKINRPQIQNLFRLRFIEDNANVIFISTVGLGKSHFSYRASATPPACAATRCSSPPRSISSTRSPLRRRTAASNANCASICSRASCSSTNWAICPSTNTAPTCSSRSSANAMSTAPSS